MEDPLILTVPIINIPEPTEPICKCDRSSVLKHVLKEGSNKGRPFYTCEKSKCKFFLWADLQIQTTSSSDAKEEFIIQRKRQKQTEDESVEVNKNQKLLVKKTTVDFTVLRNNDVAISFPYNSQLVSMVKEHIPGRSWDSDRREWTCPSTSIGHLVDLFTLKIDGVTVPDSILKLAKSMSAKSEFDTARSIHVTKIGQQLVLKFNYDLAVTDCVKCCHPRRRTYNPDDRTWTLALTALPDLLEAFDSNQDSLQLVIPEQLRSFAETAKIKLQEEEAIMREQYIKSEPWEANFMPPLEDNDDIDISGKRVKLEKETYFKPRVDNPHKNCICGEPWRKVQGVHICRLFGTFHCTRCSNRWTSAYTWRDESQMCKKCNAENMPVEVRRLEKGLGVNMQGNHDSERCGRCRKLGYPCNM